jgi:hypothetical protein
VLSPIKSDPLDHTQPIPDPPPPLVPGGERWPNPRPLAPRPSDRAGGRGRTTSPLGLPYPNRAARSRWRRHGHKNRQNLPLSTRTPHILWPIYMHLLAANARPICCYPPPAVWSIPAVVLLCWVLIRLHWPTTRRQSASTTPQLILPPTTREPQTPPHSQLAMALWPTASFSYFILSNCAAVRATVHA